MRFLLIIKSIKKLIKHKADNHEYYGGILYMSGGHFDYSEYRLDNIITELQEIIEGDRATLCYSDQPVCYSPETIASFKQAIQSIKIAKIMIGRISNLLEGDDGEENYHIRLKEELSKVENPLTD